MRLKISKSLVPLCRRCSCHCDHSLPGGRPTAKFRSCNVVDFVVELSSKRVGVIVRAEYSTSHFSTHGATDKAPGGTRNASGALFNLQVLTDASSIYYTVDPFLSNNLVCMSIAHFCSFRLLEFAVHRSRTVCQSLATVPSTVTDANW